MGTGRTYSAFDARVARIVLMPMTRMKKVPTSAETVTLSWRGLTPSWAGVTTEFAPSA